MQARLESQRRRAAYGLAVLVGILLAFLAGTWVFPALGVPGAFLALGTVVGAPVFLVLYRSLGAARALLLALLTAMGAAAIFALLAFGACAASGCVG